MGFSEKQREILRFPYQCYDALICDGAVRSGKTSVMSLSFFLWAMGRFNGCAFALCGKSVGAVERNIVTPLLAVQYLRQNFTISYSRSGHVITARRGVRENRFYLFGGKDESSYTLIQGITLAGVLLDEVALMPRSFVEQAMARCSVTGAKLWFNCNPEHPQHWFYREWILKAESRNALYLHFTMEDNPGLSRAVRQRYRRMFTGVFYSRFIEGKWVAASGLIYPFAPELLCTAPPAGAERYAVSIDYGTVNPTSMGLWAHSGGVWYRIDEYYYDARQAGQRRTDEEHFRGFLRLIEGRAPETVVCDPSAASFIELLRGRGYAVTPARNDVLNGIRATATALKSGRIRLCACCADTVRELSLYRWANDGARDVPVKENDHAMDDIRYFVSTVLPEPGQFACAVERRTGGEGGSFWAF